MRRALVLAITLASGLAPAHVAPSVDDNNRYLKVTPLGDRVRLAYTVFFGEVPGATARQSIDTNRDGSISGAEADSFGTRVAGDVAAALEVTIDGGPTKVAWSQLDVGMGSPKTAAGAFSIDMVAYFCLPAARGQHAVRVRDRYRIARPGETEVKVEDSPGITVHHARIGAADDPTHDYRFVGPGGPLSDDGLDVSFTAGEAAQISGTCGTTTKPRTIPTLAIVGAAAVLGFVLAAIVVLVRRHKRRT
ncbi:MAG TPA: hypothetical protein VIU61_06605 [Kofleriaceae bacterium]